MEEQAYGLRFGARGAGLCGLLLHAPGWAAGRWAAGT